MTLLLFIAGTVALVAGVMWLERICNPTAASGGAGDEFDEFEAWERQSEVGW